MKARHQNIIDNQYGESFNRMCFVYILTIIVSHGTFAIEINFNLGVTNSTDEAPIPNKVDEASIVGFVFDNSSQVMETTMPQIQLEKMSENITVLEEKLDSQEEKLDTVAESVISSEVTTEDRMGNVKRRAIRGLMKMFGMSDDAIMMHEMGQFGPAPEFMIDLYNTVTDTYGVTRTKNPYSAHVIRSFMEHNSSKYDYFYFNLTANGRLEETERILEAELHLYRKPTPHDRLHPSLYLTPFYILSLYQVTDSRNLNIPDLHKLLGVHYVPALGSGWEIFNVTQVVTEWLNGEKENLGFIVAATSLGGDRVPVTFARRADGKAGEKSNKQPILVLFNHDSEVEKMNTLIQPPETNNRMNRGQLERSKILEKSNEESKNQENEENNSAPILPNIPNSSLENPRFHHSLLYHDIIRHPNSVSRFRSRRSKNQTEHREASNATANHSKNITSCSKHDLFISFEAIGWSSWIISPKGYNAYYCTGPCVFPLNHEVTPTNHATLQSIAHELSLAPDVGRPCCVPTKLLPLSLLYYDDDDNVVLKSYVEMIVDTCGCH